MHIPRHALSLSAVFAVGVLGLLAIGLGDEPATESGDPRAEAADPVPSVLRIEERGLRYTYHVISGSEALFDLRADPGSLRNLLPTRAAEAARLRRALERQLGVSSLEQLRESRRHRIEELKALGYL